MSIQEPEVRRRIEHLETLIQDLERLPDPAARDQARELVQTLLDFHGAAVSRLLERIAEHGRARTRPDRVAGGRRPRVEPAVVVRSSSRSTWRPASVRPSSKCGPTSAPTGRRRAGGSDRWGRPPADAGELPRLSVVGDDSQECNRRGNLRGRPRRGGDRGRGGRRSAQRIPALFFPS